MKFFDKTLAAIAMLTLVVIPHVSAQKALPAYRDRSKNIEVRVKDLRARMTVEEKVAQLRSSMKRSELDSVIRATGLGEISPVLRSLSPKEAAKKSNAVQKIALEKSRLGIPVIFHDEGLHGLIGTGATSFPQSIGLAATWDPALVADVAGVIGVESRSRGIRHLLSPVINIARDVRWGRVEETYGEDPFLQSRIAVAYCKALEDQGVVTTPKHFIANYGDGGRDSHPIHLSERELREVYFPPFKACVEEAGARSIMASYNALNDVPCSANSWLLNDILRKEWGFAGFVVSDYGSVWGIKEKHAVAATPKDAAIQAVEAGLDMELPNIEYYGKPLLDAANDGSVSIAAIDSAVTHVLRVKFSLGLFEQPYVDAEKAAGLNNNARSRELAHKAAQKAIVLLRNKNGTLPLSKNLRSVAVIGPNADAEQLGGYSGFGIKVVTALQGIQGKVSAATQVTYSKGCEIGFGALQPIPSENLVPPNAKPGEHGLRGEYFANKDLSGVPVFVRIDPQIHFEWQMGSPDPRIPVDHYSVRWTGKIVPVVSGTYTFGASTDDGVRLYLDGKLLFDNWYDRGATLDAVTLHFEAGRSYDLRVEYYENDGWAYASLDWEPQYNVHPLIKAAAEAAKNADVAIIVTGIIEGEGYDRANLDLPGRQEQLIRAVAATGTPTIVVLINGSAITMNNWADSVGAIIEAWYPGEEGGNAIADVLFGEYNPGGKLPITFPQFVGQVPLYYNTKPTGRGYDYSDMSGKPLFPFGFGLSYTNFAYSNLRFSDQKIKENESVSVSVDIQNTGEVSGDEVIQLYLHDPVASVTRPLKELKGFRRISLQPGEKSTVTFSVGRKELEFLDRAMKLIVEPGEIEVMIGSSSADIRAVSAFTILPR